LNYYEEYNMATTFSVAGGSGSVSATGGKIKFIRVGTLVMCHIAKVAFAVTGNVTLVCNSAVPARFQNPEEMRWYGGPGFENSAFVGMIQYNKTDNKLYFYKDYAGGGFPGNSGTTYVFYQNTISWSCVSPV
jgi:hypothetical protein